MFFINFKPGGHNRFKQIYTRLKQNLFVTIQYRFNDIVKPQDNVLNTAFPPPSFYDTTY